MNIYKDCLLEVTEKAIRSDGVKRKYYKRALERSFEVFANSSMIRSTSRESKICFSVAIASKDSNLS